MELIFLLLKFGLFAGLLLFQIKQFMASQEASRNVLKALEKFDSSEVPGWGTAMDRFDRSVEPQLDDIRRFSNAALVIGIGGTMGLFFLGSLSLGSSLISGDEPSEGLKLTVFVGLILALFASIIGVVNHLVISSKIKVQTEVSKKWESLVKEAGNSNGPDPPETPREFFEAVQKFLEEQREFISELQKGFREQQSVAQQVLDAQKELKDIQTGVSDNLEHLTHAIEGIKDSADAVKMLGQPLLKMAEQLHGLPERMEAIMSEAFGTWEERITNGQDSFTQQLQGLLSDIKVSSEAQKYSAEEIQKHQSELQNILDGFLTELMESLRSLSKNLATLPDKISRSLGNLDEVFGAEAKRHVADLSNALQIGRDDLIREVMKNQDELRTWLINHSEGIIKDIFDPLKDELHEKIIAPLNRLCQTLDKTSEVMPDAAGEFGTKLQESANILSGIPTELKAATERIDKTLQSTTVDVLKPVSTQMEDFMGTIQDTHVRMGEIVRSLVHTIENLVKELE